jgi:hypothetical protein
MITLHEIAVRHRSPTACRLVHKASSEHKTLRILRLVLHNWPQTAGCKGQNTPSVGNNPRFGAAVVRKTGSASCLQVIETRTVSANLEPVVILAIPMHSA